MADKDRTDARDRLDAREQLIEEGKRAKEEHAAKHGDDSPTSAAATAEECAALGRAHGFGTYAADESVADGVAAPANADDDERADRAEAKAVERAPENKAQRAPEKK
jgi:hypothetical protein